MSAEPSKTINTSRTIGDFETIAAETIRTLRGTQSQKVLSRRLGYGSNVVHYWETGKRTPTLTKTMEVALLNALPEKSKKLATKLSNKPGIASFLAEITEGISLKVLAEQMDTNRSSLSRWRSGISEPNLPQFLFLFDLATGRVLDFLDLFLDVDQLESVHTEWSQLCRLRAVVNILPITVPLLCALDLEGYKSLPEHQVAFLAKKLGLQPMEITIALEQMQSVNMIRFHEGRFQPVNETLDLFLHVPNLWDRLGVEEELSGAYIGTVSQSALTKIRSRMERFLFECQVIAEADEEKERIIIVSLKMGNLDVQEENNANK